MLCIPIKANGNKAGLVFENMHTIVIIICNKFVIANKDRLATQCMMNKSVITSFK